MLRATITFIALMSTWCEATPIAQAIDRGDRVQLDIVVTDQHGLPVTGLRSEDFTVMEDGTRVVLTTVREVVAAGQGVGAQGRSIVILLDDLLVPSVGAMAVQRIARLFLGRAGRDDAISVVRLTHHEDEAITPRLIAVARIADYVPTPVPTSPDQATKEGLNAIARISREVDSEPPRRTALICIGAQTVCNPSVSAPRYSAFWSPWRSAIRSAGHASVAMYFVDPAGMNSMPDFADGLTEQTGGTAFVHSNNFALAADAIWDEISHYCLLTYTPATAAKPLHSVRVKVARRGVRVRARPFRAE